MSADGYEVRFKVRSHGAQSEIRSEAGYDTKNKSSQDFKDDHDSKTSIPLSLNHVSEKIKRTTKHPDGVSYFFKNERQKEPRGKYSLAQTIPNNPSSNIYSLEAASAEVARFLLPGCPKYHPITDKQQNHTAVVSKKLEGMPLDLYLVNLTLEEKRIFVERFFPDIAKVFGSSYVCGEYDLHFGNMFLVFNKEGEPERVVRIDFGCSAWPVVAVLFHGKTKNAANPATEINSADLDRILYPKHYAPSNWGVRSDRMQGYLTSSKKPLSKPLLLKELRNLHLRVSPYLALEDSLPGISTISQTDDFMYQFFAVLLKAALLDGNHYQELIKPFVKDDKPAAALIDFFKKRAEAIKLALLNSNSFTCIFQKKSEEFSKQLVEELKIYNGTVKKNASERQVDIEKFEKNFAAFSDIVSHKQTHAKTKVSADFNHLSLQRITYEMTWTKLSLVKTGNVSPDNYAAVIWEILNQYRQSRNANWSEIKAYFHLPSPSEDCYQYVNLIVCVEAWIETKDKETLNEIVGYKQLSKVINYMRLLNKHQFRVYDNDDITKLIQLKRYLERQESQQQIDYEFDQLSL